MTKAGPGRTLGRQMLAAVLFVALAAEPSAPIDLSPLLAGAPAADGSALFESGRFAESASKLAGSPLPAAAFVRAAALVEAGRGGEAIGPLSGLEARLPEIADRVALLRGRALEAAGRGQEALAAFAAVPDGSLVAAQARIARARIAAAAGDHASGLEALAPLLGAPPPADQSRPDAGATALLLAGRLDAARGDGEAARRAWLACWVAHPLTPESADCRAAVARLPKPWNGPPAIEDVLARAEALLDGNRNGAALALLGPLLDELPEAGPGEGVACRARAAAGRAHRKERSYERAIAVLRPVAESCDEPGVRVRALYLLASATSIAGDKDESLALYRRLAKEFPDHALADDALFFAADLLLRAGRNAEARDALGEVVRDHARGDYHDEARFRLAWLSKQEGDSDGAVSQLLAIEEDVREDGYERERAAYWRARLLAGRGEAARRTAMAVWEGLASAHPAGYYGLLARARLAAERAAERAQVPAAAPPVLASTVSPPPTAPGAQGVAQAQAPAAAPPVLASTVSPPPTAPGAQGAPQAQVPAAVPPPAQGAPPSTASTTAAVPPPSAAAAAPQPPPPWDPGTLHGDPHFRAGVLLLRIGLSRLAAEELAAVDAARLGDGSSDAPESVLVLADLLDRAGDHRSAHNLVRARARGALRLPPDGENRRVWSIAYPAAYRDEVRRWAAPAGVPADLVHALMREESALDPRAVSPAGAIGLTQLMLPTAQSVARRIGMGRVARADLSVPSVNIRLGARHLGDLVRRFGGSVPLALAAYNAGGGAVSRWLEQRRGLALDEFVEEIPYEETRGYVKRVLRSYAAYQLLFGEPADPDCYGLLGAVGKS